MRSNASWSAGLHFQHGCQRFWGRMCAYEHVSHLRFISTHTCFDACFLFNRYNTYRRVITIMDKIKNKKPVKLDATFFPQKRKRVLNKRTVLNKKTPDFKPAKRPRSPVQLVLEPKTEPEDENALDSQSSITSIFWDSQGLGATPPNSPVSRLNHTTPPPCHHTNTPSYHLVTICVSRSGHHHQRVLR